MTILTRAALLCFAALSLPLHAEADPPTAISINVYGDIVTASGLTPGGEVAMLAVWSNDVAPGTTNAGVLSETADADATGSASITFRQQLPPRTLVAVIDVKSGRIEVFAEQPRFRRLELPPRRLKRDDARDVDAVLSPFEFAVTVVVRPAVGAWIHSGGDGGATDGDGRADGGVRTGPEAMRPLGDAPPPPRKITPRDMVLSIAPDAGVFSIAEVTP